MVGSHRIVLYLALVVGSHAVGCDGPTQVILHFEAEASIASRPVALCVRVRDAGMLRYDQCRAPGELTFPTTVPVSTDGATSEFTIDAALTDSETSEVVGRVLAALRFEPHETREARFRFDASCVGTTCGSEETCVEGVCVESCFQTSPEGSSARSMPIACDPPELTDGGVGCDCPCAGDACTDGVCHPADSAHVLSVSAGDVHTCAITSSGAVYCWGVNSKGQLGDGTTMQSSVPVMAEIPGATDVLARSDHTCAIAPGGHLWCWGNDGAVTGVPHNRPGIDGGYNMPVVRPVLLDNEPLVASISGGASHTCGLDLDASKLLCMGQNDQLQLGYDLAMVMSHGNLQYVPHIDIAARVSSGENHTCAIQDGRVWCFGRNDHGQCGVDASSSTMAQTITTSVVFVALGAGWDHTCGISDTSELYCWGAGDQFRLGTGTTDDSTAPVRVGTETGWTLVDGGRTHTCAIRAAGELYCWGSNVNGEVGDHTRMTALSPVRIAGDSKWAEVSAGDGYTCAIRTDGSLYCWGGNATGQLGVGFASESIPEPTRVCVL